MRNAILEEGGSAHVDDFNDPELAWFWHSNARTTGIVLNSFVKANVSPAPIRQMVRWLMLARNKGRWGNTQENATALEALVDYYRKYEAEPPDFKAVVTLGRQTLASHEFQGRSTEAVTRTAALARIAAKENAGERLDLSFERKGAGTLHYVARLRYAPADPPPAALDQGFAVERTYTPEGGGEAATSFAAGQLVRVTLAFELPKERRYVAVTDPLPAGLEPVESWFATTAADLAGGAEPEDDGEGADPSDWWERGGFDRVERHDDRVLLFATRLSEGRHVFSYLARATTAGQFTAAPARAEEMYEPEVFGRTGATVIEVRP
jgi:hypothetical protein